LAATVFQVTDASTGIAMGGETKPVRVDLFPKIAVGDAP
jgi:hypothetical protein